jgi:hypothetical protein
MMLKAKAAGKAVDEDALEELQLQHTEKRIANRIKQVEAQLAKIEVIKAEEGSGDSVAAAAAAAGVDGEIVTQGAADNAAAAAGGDDEVEQLKGALVEMKEHLAEVRKTLNMTPEEKAAVEMEKWDGMRKKQLAQVSDVL